MEREVNSANPPTFRLNLKVDATVTYGEQKPPNSKYARTRVSQPCRDCNGRKLIERVCWPDL